MDAMTLFRPTRTKGLVLCAHAGAGDEWHARQAYVADALTRRGFEVNLAPLLGVEEVADPATRDDVGLQTTRLVAMLDRLADLGPIGLTGAGGAAAAALAAARLRPEALAALALVSPAFETDPTALEGVETPTLILAGECDREGRSGAVRARTALNGPARLRLVHGAGPFFEERDALDKLAGALGEWFDEHLSDSAPPPRDDADGGLLWRRAP
jgi:putative phosphoribosyl transferase